MLRSKFVVLSLAITAVFAACQRHEASPTGSYGDRVIAGQVVMASQMANGSPAGVEVSVPGTGMTATLTADGRFTFVGVPDNAQVTFRRADGINATVSAKNANGVLELSTNGAKQTSSKHRGTTPNDPGPAQQIEGKITQVATDGSSITVHDSHGKDVPVALTSTTLIRKGDKVVKATALAVGDQVHVKATMVNNVLTASQVVVQEPDDDDNGNTAAAIGTVKSVGTNSLVVTTKSGDVTVNTDQNTVFLKDGQKVTLADIKTGDQIAAAGTKVDPTTILAKTVVVRGTANPFMSVEGTVKSVSGTSFVVTAKAGDITVNTDANTVVEKDEHKATVADIKVGDRVEAQGTRVDATTMLAKAIEDESAGGTQFTDVEGTVKSVGTNSFVVTTRKGDVTVNVDANTVITRDGQTITLADLKAGDLVAAAGTPVDATTMLAKTVVVHSATDQFMEVEGTVKSVGTSSLVVTTEHGDVTVNTDQNTVITRDGQKAALTDIKQGDRVEAAGTKVDATTMLAKFIATRSAGDSHD